MIVFEEFNIKPSTSIVKPSTMSLSRIIILSSLSFLCCCFPIPCHQRLNIPEQFLAGCPPALTLFAFPCTSLEGVSYCFVTPCTLELGDSLFYFCCCTLEVLCCCTLEVLCCCTLEVLCCCTLEVLCCCTLEVLCCCTLEVLCCCTLEVLCGAL